MNKLKAGTRVVIVGEHPWATHAATLVAYERYGLGWMGWRVALDEPYQLECYAKPSQIRRTP